MSSTEAEAVTRSIRRHLAIGMAVGLALIGAAGAWATTTQLAGAVVASGNFVVDSHVKKVQHPTGGVIGEILVEEGDWVKAGQVLMRLDPTQTKANLRIVTKRLDELMARLARLEAERDDRGELEFPTELKVRAKERAVASAINGESKLFEYRRRSREGRRSQLLERIVQLQHEIAGLDAQQQAYDRGLSILDAEIASLRSLHERGIVSVQRLNELETRAATFEGLRGEKIAQQAQAAGRIAETRLQILQIDEDLKTEVGRELREVQAQLGEFTERKIAAEDQLRRIDMLAPQGGIVHQLNVRPRQRQAGDRSPHTATGHRPDPARPGRGAAAIGFQSANHARARRLRIPDRRRSYGRSPKRPLLLRRARCRTRSGIGPVGLP